LTGVPPGEGADDPPRSDEPQVPSEWWAELERRGLDTSDPAVRRRLYRALAAARARIGTGGMRQDDDLESRATARDWLRSFFGRGGEDEVDGPEVGAEEPDAGSEDHRESDLTTGRKRFRAATDDELDPQSFIVSDDRSALRAVLRGGSISDDRGDADFIGGAVRRLARALRQSAEAFRAPTGFVSNPLLRRLEFGHSVIVELEISPDEDVQLDLESGRHSPTIEAARAIGRLLASDTEHLVPRALELGPDAVAAYKRFLNVLAEDNVTLEWLTPGTTEVVAISSVDARHDFAILDREGDRVTEPVTVPGTLTMADSELKQFALTLPANLARPPLLKGKHRVRGTYSDDVGEHLKAEGLWDSEVMAVIEVNHDVPGSTPAPRDDTYTLVHAESLISPSLFDLE
jgi:hypothetical protein